ncbi:hypothetical protein CTO_0993 [Chlamydia trachomatis A2497]|uniref:Uncharacterized protein n=1 Tax=Chlamydia trachomatis serovar A (strain A2497) TaxID=580047 RepID=G4NN13_CHLT4|nr:hypothetical protein CTO_0993 [Chlamydia trachomatis A2497]
MILVTHPTNLQRQKRQNPPLRKKVRKKIGFPYKNFYNPEI